MVVILPEVFKSIVFIFRNYFFGHCRHRFEALGIYMIILILNIRSFEPYEIPSQFIHINQTDSILKRISTEARNKCFTRSCIITDLDIREYLDESENPCENFHKFACGNFIKNTIIPENKVSVDTFSVVADVVSEQLRSIMSESIDENASRPFQLARNFHASCMNTTIIEERGINPFLDILKEFGGWPVIEGDSWCDNSFDWVQIIKQFRRRGFNTRVILSLGLGTDTKNSTRRVLIVRQICNSIRITTFK